MPNGLRCWIAVLMAGLASGHAQQASPPPGFPGGGLWKAPPNRAVPIELADGVMIARGSISGVGRNSGPMAFVVDTAATSTMVDAGVAHWLGWIPAAGATRYPGRTLELAGASVADRLVFGLPLAGLSEQIGDPVQGIAGSDIFLHFAVRIDYVQRGLTLTFPESCTTPERRLPVRLVGGLPFVQASVGVPGGLPVEGLFLVDTGQPGTGLVLTSEFLAQHPDLTAKQTQVRLPGFDSKGEVKDTVFQRMGTLQIAGYQLGAGMAKGVVATVAAPSTGGDSGLAGVIGAGVLSRFDLLVDLPGRWLTLKPNAYFSGPFEADMSGILLLSGDRSGRSGEPGSRAGEHVYTIAGIAEKSPASEAGLQAGDRLTAIADRKVTDMSMDQIRGMLKSGPGTKLMVGVDRSGKKFQVVLTLRRAI